MRRSIPIFYSALMLTGVNLLLRMVGTSFQVFLSGQIGAAGIGLLQLVLSVGTLAMTAGIAGVRTATMYLTAEELGKQRPGSVIWVISGALRYSMIFSCGISAALFFLGPVIAEHWIGDIRALDAVRVYAAFLPVCCLTGVMTGYFTAANRIGTLAAVEVAEQALSIGITVCALRFWAGTDPAKACMAVILGSGCGACLTVLCLVVLRRKERCRHDPKIPVAGRLCRTAVPLALADNLKAGISTGENLMVPKRLALFEAAADPLAVFGTVCGMVFPILMFPACILFGLTELLIPELARCNAAGSRMRIRYLVRRSLRLALLYGILCSGILFLCSDALCIRLYQSADAGTYLRWFSLLAVMLYCDIITDAMIKGLGQQKYSVYYNIITSVLDLGLLFVLLPRYGIPGYFFSFAVTHGINFALSLHRLQKITKLHLHPHIPIQTLGTAAVCILTANLLPNPFLKSAAYILLLFSLLTLLGVLSKEDLHWLKRLIRLHPKDGSAPIR